MELEDNNHVSSFLDGDLMGFDSMVHFWVPKSWITVKPQHYQWTIRLKVKEAGLL